MTRRTARVLALVAAAALSMGQSATRGIPVSLENLVEADVVQPGAHVRLALRVQLPAGFHVQSNAPKDPGLIATMLWVASPAGVTVTEIVFPASTEFRQQGVPEPLMVFERSFVIGIRVAIQADSSLGEMVIPARLRYQTCDDTVCFRPVTVATSWTIRVASIAAGLNPEHRALFEAIAFGRGQAPATLPPPPPVTAGTGPTPGTDSRGELALLDDFTVLGTAGGFMKTAEFLQFIKDAESGVMRRGLLEGRGPLAILLIVFLGGLALNLTPCVLPMIPINLAIIGAGTQAGRRGRGFWLGATYGGAMALVYGTLGLVVILTAGTFGTINASPWFNAGIAALFIVLGLAMFDIVTIDFSRLSSRIRFDEASRGTFLLAFGMGAVAALLAGACVAPVVIQVVLFASDLYARGTTTALALPFLLGLGMALPWPVAGAGLASLPKPGAWMEKVKYAFGVFILATATYYGYVAYGIFADRWVDPASVAASVEEKLKAGWHSSLARGLEAARRDQTPVLVDFWATWCKNCLAMDRTTLADPSVKDALAGYTLIKFQAEDPEASPAKELMDRFKAIGLPTYVILRPNAPPR